MNIPGLLVNIDVPDLEKAERAHRRAVGGRVNERRLKRCLLFDPADLPGKPMANATVVLVPPLARRQNRALYRMATSDANGHFSFRGVAPEDYQLFAWQNIAPSAYLNARFLSKYEDRATPVKLGPSSTITATITGIPKDGQ